MKKVLLIMIMMTIMSCENGGKPEQQISVGILPNETFVLNTTSDIELVAVPEVVAVMVSFGLYDADEVEMINGRGIYKFTPPEVGVGIPLTFIGIDIVGKQIAYAQRKVTVTLSGTAPTSPSMEMTYMVKNRFDLNAFSNSTTSLYGVHEITFEGTHTDVVTVTSNGKTVYAFYDGNGIMKARIYCEKVGANIWTASNGMSGTFTVTPSLLNGKIRTVGTKFRTDSGKPFGVMVDTQYTLTYSGFNTFTSYLNDIVQYGVTIVRTGIIGVFGKEIPNNFDVKDKIKRYYNGDEFNYPNFQADDQKFQWALRNYPDMQFQLILYGGPSEGYRQKDLAMNNLGERKRAELLKYMVARYAAYPNVIFLIYNDAAYGPMNTRLATEALSYLMHNDVYQTARATGGVRGAGYNPAFLNGLSTYIHLETAGDLGAKSHGNYGLPTFTFEDYYERLQKHGHNTDILNSDPSYFYRRLQWSWFLSGGGASYGNDLFHRTRIYSGTGLKGLNDIKHHWGLFEILKININDLVVDNSAYNHSNGEDRVHSAQTDRFLIAYNPVGGHTTIHPDFIGMQYSIYNPSNGVFTPWAMLMDDSVTSNLKDYVVVIKRWGVVE